MVLRRVEMWGDIEAEICPAREVLAKLIKELSAR